MGPKMSHRFLHSVGLAGLLALVALPALAQTAAPPAPQSAPVDTDPVVAKGPAHYATITVHMSSGKMVNLPQRVASVFAADPSVAEVRPASPTKLFIFGRAVGETTVVATDTAGNTILQLTVFVQQSTFAQDQIKPTMQAAGAGDNVKIAPLGSNSVLTGTVDTPQQAYDAIHAAAGLSKNGGLTINELEVRQPTQVELKVRIASMSRTVTRTLGINWQSVGDDFVQVGKFAIGGAANTGVTSSLSGSTPSNFGVRFPGGTFEGVIDALAEDNMAHILAEPTLTTMSGTEATFHSGGEYPYATATSSGSSSTGGTSVSVVFQTYGVTLKFTPVVLSDGRIALTVSPTFSTLDPSNSVTIDGSTEPAIKDTEATSSIILGSGQGMAIAGMLLDQTSQTDNAVPGLGEMPVLGALFRGDEYQRAQQELVITVTPYLVSPVDHPGALASPDDGWTPANDLQRILLLRDNGTDPANPAQKIPGDAGFMVQ
jgi:pilus assembly protein CpaC